MLVLCSNEMLTKLLMRFDAEQYWVQESAAGPSCAIRAGVSRKGAPFLGCDMNTFLQLKTTEVQGGTAFVPSPFFLHVMGAK
jgi:hypothetical protein